MKERGVIQVKGKGEMLTYYVKGRRLGRDRPLGRTISSVANNGGLAEVVYSMVRARKRRTGKRSEFKKKVKNAAVAFIHSHLCIHTTLERHVGKAPVY